jgi:hypothetical protein
MSMDGWVDGWMDGWIISLPIMDYRCIRKRKNHQKKKELPLLIPFQTPLQ